MKYIEIIKYIRYILILLIMVNGMVFSKNNLIFNYIKFIKKSSKIVEKNIIERQVDYNSVAHHQQNFAESSKQPLKSLDIFIDPSPDRKKYLIVKEMPLLIIYIPWKYGYSIDPAEIQRINYFLEMALERGYNKFILQMIWVNDSIRYGIGINNFNVLFKLIHDFLKNFIKNNNGDKLLLKNELILHSLVEDVTNVHGGFFLIANKIHNNKKINLN